MRFAHATNVSHYGHVIGAMNTLSHDVTLVSRYQLNERHMETLGSVLPQGRGVERLLRRRLVDEEARASRTRYLPASQLLFPLAARLHLPVYASVLRAIHARYQLRVAAVTRGADVLHSVDGLAAMAFAQNCDLVKVLERRNFHHSVFEAELDVLEGFPHARRLDPLRHSLELEYDLADRIVVYSDAVRESMIRYGVTASKVDVIPLPVSIPQAHNVSRTTRRDSRRLLYVGRVDAFKGVDVAVAATRRLSDRVTLRIAGPASAESITWIERQGSRVEYLGIMSREELAKEYESCGAMLAPSVESFGLAVAEAWGAGVPVLARETTGVAQYLAGMGVHVVKGRDPDVWADAIANVLARGRDTAPSERLLPSVLSKDSVVRSLSQLYSAQV